MYQLFYTWISQHKFTSINLFTCWTVLVCLFTWYKPSYLLSWYKYTQFWLSFSKLLLLVELYLSACSPDTSALTCSPDTSTHNFGCPFPNCLFFYYKRSSICYLITDVCLMSFLSSQVTLSYYITFSSLLWVILLPKHTHQLSYYRFNIHILTVIAGSHIVSAIFNTQRMNMYI